MEKVHYQGHGDQMRLRLSVPMATLEQAMSAAGGRLDRFVEAVPGSRNRRAPWAAAKPGIELQGTTPVRAPSNLT